jgi:hypothetical protein
MLFLFKFWFFFLDARQCPQIKKPVNAFEHDSSPHVKEVKTRNDRTMVRTVKNCFIKLQNKKEIVGTTNHPI